MPARNGLATPIFGRDPELGSLRAELGAAMQGSGRLVVLVGDAGIGKTTLAAAHAAEAEKRGTLVAWGRCRDVPGAPAYWPWIQILESLERAHSDGAAADLHEVRALLPELRASAEPTHSVSAQTRFELFARVARALARLSEKCGLEIVIDDLHWADASSRRLLQFLAGELSTDPVLVVAILRTHESETDETLEELARLARTIPVGPLDPEAVESLLEERLPSTAPSRDPDRDRVALLREVSERSQGNPFFVLELAQLASTDTGSDTRPALPAGVKTVLERRLAALSDEARRVLQAAAVIGRVFDVALLARVLEADEASLIRAIEPALALGIVSAQPGTAGRFAFSHGLTREALYESLPASEASALHARVAEALETGDDAREGLLNELAHHYFEAAATLGSEPAIGAALSAGKQLLGLLAYEEAATQFERAIAALGSTEDPRGIEARIGLGEARLGMGDREGAERVAAEAIDLARAGNHAPRLAEAVLCWATAREEISQLDVETNDALESALDAVGDDADAGLRARLTARFATGLHLVPGSEARRRALTDTALALAAEADEPGTTSIVTLRRLGVLHGPDDLEERIAALDEMLVAARDHPIAELNALTFRLDALAEQGDRAGLDAALASFEQKARRVRHPFFRWTGASIEAAMALLEGRYEAAETKIVEALRLGSQVQAQTPGLHFAQQMFMLRGWQDRIEEVAPLVDGSAEAARVVPAWRCAVANVRSMQGRFDEARSEVEAVMATGLDALPRDTTWLTSMTLLASVCSQLGAAEHADALYDRLAPYAGRVAMASPLVVVLSPVELSLGMLASMLQRYDDAERHFDATLALSERMRGGPWQADVRYQHASMLLGRDEPGDAERAEQMLAKATSTARSLGMQCMLRWVEELRTESAGQEPPASVVQPAQQARFECDGEVWTLAFDGQTTRLRSIAGLRYLHRLLSHAGEELHALDLAAEAPARASQAVLGDAGEALDPQARAEYRARLRDLDEDLAEAERLNDRGRAEAAAEQREALMAELARGFGLGGRARRVGSAAERARLSVTRAIKYALKKIAEHDPALAAILERDVRTGAFCSYAPVERDRIDWTL